MRYVQMVEKPKGETIERSAVYYLTYPWPKGSLLHYVKALAGTVAPTEHRILGSVSPVH